MLRRVTATLDYYRLGSMPDAFATLPKDWTLDQIKQFQDYFDALMSGNLARRRMVKFMPSEFRLTETRQPPLKDQYDEWLARVICYAFSIPPSAFVAQVNRATSETLRIQASQEGLVPLKAWVKGALDYIIQVCLKQPDLEFAWVGDDAVDPLQQAQTLNILVSAGIKTKEEARAERGLAPEPTAAPGMAGPQPAAAVGVAKYSDDQPRDERGRRTTEGATGGPSKPNPAGREHDDQPTSPRHSTDSQTDTSPAFAPPLVVPAIGSAAASSGAGLPPTLASILPFAATIASVVVAAGVLLVPLNSSVEQGTVPGRPDIEYRWAHDETTVTYRVQIDGQWLTLPAFQDASGSLFRDARGNVLAAIVYGTDSRITLATDIAALDRAAAAQRNELVNAAPGAPAGAPGDESNTQSGGQQIYFDPSTGQTIVAPAGADPSTLPPGFIPMGSGESADRGPTAPAGAAAVDDGETFVNPQSGQLIQLPLGADLRGDAPPGFISLRSLPPGTTFLPAPPAAPGSSLPGSVADFVAPNGVLPGTEWTGYSDARTMSESENPNGAALQYILDLCGESQPVSITPLPNNPGAFVIQMADGTYITYRPSGSGGIRTDPGTATVEINGATINIANGGKALKLKFPKM